MKIVHLKIVRSTVQRLSFVNIEHAKIDRFGESSFEDLVHFKNGEISSVVYLSNGDASSRVSQTILYSFLNKYFLVKTNPTTLKYNGTHKTVEKENCLFRLKF